MKLNVKKINLLTIIRHPVGGIRTYLKYTYNKLNVEKYNLMILVVYEKENENEITALKEDLKIFFPNIIYISSRIPVIGMTRILYQLLSDNEIHLIHSQGTTSGIIASFVNLKYRLPHVITLHETFDEKIIQRGKNIKKVVIPILFNTADYLNVVSEDAKDNIIHYFTLLKRNSNKIIVIRNGVDVDYFTANIQIPESIYDIDGIKNNDFVVGYLGRYMPEKGFRLLIEAMKIIKSRYEHYDKIKVLCLGWNAYIREYKQLINDYGIEENFCFIEYQPDARWILRGVNVVAVPSLREAYGLVAIEALLSGTPVVASNCIGLRETLKDTPATLCEAGNSYSLACAILNEITHSKKKKVDDYMSIAKKRYDSRVTAEELDNLFRSALEKGALRSSNG